MFTHALMGGIHTLRSWAMVTLLPSATKRRHGRRIVPLSFAMALHVGASRRPRRRATHPTAPMMNTFKTALKATRNIRSAMDISPARGAARARRRSVGGVPPARAVLSDAGLPWWISSHLCTRGRYEMSRTRSGLFRADVTRGFGSPTVGTGKRSFPRERRQGGNAVGKVSTVPRTPRARLRRFDTTPRRLHTPPFVQRALQDASHPSSRNVVSRQSRHHDVRRIGMTYKGGPDAAAAHPPRACSLSHG